MKKLFKLTLAAILLAGNVGVANAAVKGEKTFGVRTGYVSRNSSAAAGLFFQYAFTDYLRIQPSADIIFRHRDRDAYTIDLNAQVPIQIGAPNRCSLYPYAGLNFSSWNHHDFIYSDFPPMDSDASSRRNYFGVNLGAGFDLKVSSTLKVSIEAGYTLVKRNSGVRILAGIGYIF